MKNIVDGFLYEKDRKVLVYENLGLKNLRSIGHASVKNAFPPLEQHIHKDCIEIVTVVKGRQTYIAGGNTYRLTGGDVFLSFLDQPHGSGENLQDINEIIWMQIDMRYEDGFLGLCSEYGKILHSKLLSIRAPAFKIDRASIRILMSAFESFSKMTQDEIQTGQSLLVTFMNRLARSQSDSEEMEYRFKEVIRYIEGNLCENIEISTLSQMCNLSESGFKHRFSELVGIPPKQYINLKKIESAQAMLHARTGGDIVSITDVAMRYGFSSANYFSTVFKKFTGHAPSEDIKGVPLPDFVGK
ncbi:MAG: AraC family transcriptional regulator [Saccharofermentanales bacterium]